MDTRYYYNMQCGMMVTSKKLRQGKKMTTVKQSKPQISPALIQHADSLIAMSNQFTVCICTIVKKKKGYWIGRTTREGNMPQQFCSSIRKQHLHYLMALRQEDQGLFQVLAQPQ